MTRKIDFQSIKTSAHKLGTQIHVFNHNVNLKNNKLGAKYVASKIIDRHKNVQTAC